MPVIRFNELAYATDKINRSLDSFKTDQEYLGWLYANKLRTPDLSREPPLRSHARGLMTRYQMDKLDGINIRRVLEKNPLFYSSGYQIEAARLDEGDVIVDLSDLAVSGTTGDEDGQRKTKDHVTIKPKKTMKQRVKSFIRRLVCLPTKED